VNFATTLFCDDIRVEVGDKRTYVGCYDQALVVPELPFVLPRFCLSVALHLQEFPTNDVPIEAMVFLPGDAPESPSISSRSVLPAVTSHPDQDPSDPFDSSPVLKVRQDLVLSPLELRTEGRLRVRILFGSELIKAGSLEVLVRKSIAATD
jgi:hypothetical protein